MDTPTSDDTDHPSPIPPHGQGAENIKKTMAEAYATVESALPEKYKGMVINEDQDR